MNGLQKFFASLLVVIGAQLVPHATGCALFESTAKDPTTQKLIADCVHEAQMAQLDGAKPEEAVQVFDACIARGPAKDAGDAR